MSYHTTPYLKVEGGLLKLGESSHKIDLEMQQAAKLFFWYSHRALYYSSTAILLLDRIQNVSCKKLAHLNASIL